jgi:hypothetical protein
MRGLRRTSSLRIGDGVEAAFDEILRGQGFSDEDQRGAIGFAVNGICDRRERGALELLVGPARAPDDRHRAFRAIGRREVRDDLRQIVDREMDRERRAGCCERGQGLGGGHRAGTTGRAGQHHRLHEFGERQFDLQRGGGGGEGGYAGGDRERDIEVAEAAQLLAHRRPDRQVAGMEPRDVLPGVVCGLDLRNDLVERQRRGVDDARAGGTVIEHRRRDQRAGVKADGRSGDPVAAA